MKMEISKKDAGLLIGLFGVLLTVVVYYLVFMPYSEKTDRLKSENTKLKTKVQTMQVLANDIDILRERTEENKNKTRQILERFPSNVQEEDIIMLAVKLQNEAPFEMIKSLQISNATDVYAVTDIDTRVADAVAQKFGEAPIPEAVPAPVEAAESEVTPIDEVDTGVGSDGTLNLDGNYVLKERTATMNGSSSYKGFKEAIKMITNRNDRTQLSVMASYDIESGLVDSQMSLVANYMTGTGKSYEVPNIPFITQGTSNIFGTIDLTKLNQPEEIEETEESTEEAQ